MAQWGETTRLVLDDYLTAPIDEKLRATLGLLKKMTMEPDNLGPEDVRPLLALGVSRQAVQDAMHVAFLFNVYDRMADAMGWDVPAEGSPVWQSSARILLLRGYK